MSLKCPECNKNYFGYYCHPCNSKHWRDNFPIWTSDDDNIDNLIRESQINATDPGQLLEWIHYTNLENIQYIAEGGFGTVYKAIWKDGPITERYNENEESGHCWDVKKSEWTRDGETEVAVKKYRNAKGVSSDFLNEVNKHQSSNLTTMIILIDYSYFNAVVI